MTRPNHAHMYSDQEYNSVFVNGTKQVCLDTRSPDSQMNPSGQPGTDTRIVFPDLRMPSRHDIQCASYMARSLISLESFYCTKVVHTPATTQTPQLSFMRTRRSAVAKVIWTPGRLSWISDALHDPHAQPPGSRSKRPLPLVNFSRRFLS